MAEYIDRQKALAEFEEWSPIPYPGQYVVDHVKQWLKNFPATVLTEELDNAYVHGYTDAESEFRKRMPADVVERDTGLYTDGFNDGYKQAKSDAPHWIPVTQALPEDDIEVLVTDRAGGVSLVDVDKCGTHDDGTRFWYYTQNPIAWMPLPEPWKEVEA